MTSSLPKRSSIQPIPSPPKKKQSGNRGSLITLGGVLGKVKTSSKKSRFTGEGPDENVVGIHGLGGRWRRNGEILAETHRRKGGNFREMVNQVYGDWFLSCFLLWEWGFCAKSLQELMHENSLVTYSAV